MVKNRTISNATKGRHANLRFIRPFFSSSEMKTNQKSAPRPLDNGNSSGNFMHTSISVGRS